MSSVSPALTYLDFWTCHGRQSFWLTRHFSYRLGALLALLASRMGLTPHAVTILSFLTGVCGAFVVRIPGITDAAAGCLLFIALHLAYGLDCADGVLARATGRTGKTGGLLDKTADLASSMLIPGILGLSALQGQDRWIETGWIPFLLWYSITPRLAMTTINWLKEGLTPEIDRKGSTDRRARTLFWRLKKFAGNLQDDVVYRTGIAVSWACGCYWIFVLAFQTFCLLLLLIYILTTFREMAALDHASRSVESEA